MKTLLLAFLLTFLSKFTLSNQAYVEDFYFRRVVNDLKNAGSDQDTISAAIESMNKDSFFHDIAKSVLEPEMINDYVQAQCQISNMLNTDLAFVIDENANYMREFATRLLTSMDSNHELFCEDDILSCFRVIIRFLRCGVDADIQSRYISVHRKVSERLSEKSRKALLNTVLRYAGKTSWFIDYQMITSSYLPAAEIQQFMKSYFDSVYIQFDFGIQSEPFTFMLLYCHSLSKTDVEIDQETVRKALTGIKTSIGGLVKAFVEDFVIILEHFDTKFQVGETFSQIILEIIMSEHLLKHLTRDTKKHFKFSSLLLKRFLNDKNAYKALSEQLKASTIPEAKANFLFFHEFITDFHKLNFCFSNLMNLTKDSNEDQVRIAVSSAKSLHDILKKSPNLSDHFSGFSKKLVETEKIINNISAIAPSVIIKVFLDQILIYTSLIKIQINPNPDSSNNYSNLALFVGRLLSHRSSSLDLSRDLYDLVVPLIPRSCDAVIKIKELRTNELNVVVLSYYFKFAKIHSDSKFVQKVMDHLAFLYVTSYSVSKKSYIAINDLDFLSERLILNLSFEFYLNSFLESKNKSELNDLRIFFQHCLSKKALSKTEILIFESISSTFDE